MTPLRPLLLASAGLACALAAEWALPDDPAPDAPRPPALPHPSSAQAEADLDGWQATALARPLFSKTRTPADAETKPDAAEGMPRLTGVIITPHQRRAVFMTAAGASVLAQEGDDVADVTVKSIERGRVVLDHPGGEVVIRPSFDTKPQAAGRKP